MLMVMDPAESGCFAATAAWCSDLTEDQFSAAPPPRNDHTRNMETVEIPCNPEKFIFLIINAYKPV